MANVNQMKEMTKSNLRRIIEITGNGAEKEQSVPPTMYYLGESGCGKTAGQHSAAEELIGELEEPVGFIPLRLGQMEVGDIIGFPRISQVDGRDLLTWTLPSWMPSGNYRPCDMCWTRYECKKRPCRYGIVFLDEPNRMQPDVTQAVFQFIEAVNVSGHIEHRLHTHHMPPGFIVIMAGNIETDDYTLSTLDRAFLGRTCQVFIQHEPRSWIQWATDRLHGSIVGFNTAHPDASHDEVKDYDLTVKPSGRAWEYLDFIRSTDMSESLKFECYEGLVGTKWAERYVSWCNEHYKKPISAKELLHKWGDLRDDFFSRSRSSRLTTIDSMAPYMEKAKQEELHLGNLRHIFNALIDEGEEDLALALYSKLFVTIRKGDSNANSDGKVRDWIRSKSGIAIIKRINKIHEQAKKEDKKRAEKEDGK